MLCANTKAQVKLSGVMAQPQRCNISSWHNACLTAFTSSVAHNSTSPSVQMKGLWLKTNIWARFFLFFFLFFLSFSGALHSSPRLLLHTGANTNTQVATEKGWGRWMSLSPPLYSSSTSSLSLSPLNHLRGGCTVSLGLHPSALVPAQLLNRIRGPSSCFLWSSEDVCGDRLLSFIDQVEELSEQKPLNQEL